jgi:DNA modification methylase
MSDLPTESDPIRIVEGDAIDDARRLPAGVFDAVVTDPPYGQTNERYDGPDAISLRPDIWRECLRVCKPNAALISLAGGPTYHRIASAIEAGGWRVRQMWGWVYRDGMMTTAYPGDGFDRLAPAMDPIVFATKGKVLLNVEREGDHAWDRFTGRKDPYASPSLSDRCTHGLHTRKAVGRYPRTLTASPDASDFEYFVLPRASATRGEKLGHPNQKPLALMRWLIAKLPGALILDPFGGSGTTPVAAIAEGRRCVAIDQDPRYVAIARRRVAEALGTGLFVSP